MPYSDPGEEKTEPYGNPTVSSRRSLRATAAGVYRQHPDLLRNAGSLFATTGVTSLLGAAYWTLAARLFSQQYVGYGAAEVPAMTLIGTIGMLGLGTLLVGELPACRRRAELVTASLFVCSLGSLLLAVGFVLIAPRFSKEFATMFGTPDQKGLFVVGAVLTGVSMTFDMATIGVMRGGVQLARNIAFSAVKLAALPVFAFILHVQLGMGISYSWVAGIALSLVLVAIRMALSGTRVLARPDWPRLRSLGRTAMAHNWLNIATTMPPTVFPVLVTVLVSPSANAAFYVAFTLSSFVYMIPHHLSTVLFAMAAAEPHAIARRVRFAMKLSFLIGLPAIGILILASHWVLSIYGPGYARIATVPMWLLVLGYVPSVPKALYIAVCRANGRVTYVATILTLFTIVEIGAVAAGAVSGGLVGLSFALLVALTVQGVVITPPLLRAIRRRGRHRSGAHSSPVSRNEDATPGQIPEVPAASRYPADLKSPNDRSVNGRGTAMPGLDAPSKEQQQAGINALTALAKAVAPTIPMPAISMVDLTGVWPLPRPPSPSSPPRRDQDRPSGKAMLRGDDEPPAVGEGGRPDVAARQGPARYGRP